MPLPHLSLYDVWIHVYFTVVPFSSGEIGYAKLMAAEH